MRFTAWRFARTAKSLRADGYICERESALLAADAAAYRNRAAYFQSRADRLRKELGTGPRGATRIEKGES